MSISKDSQNIQFDTQKHSTAHLIAAAVKQMFPDAQFGVGPVIDNGCYYDFILPRPLIPEDLPLIESHMKEMLKQPLVFKVQEMDIVDAMTLFDSMNQPLKVELLQDLKERGSTNLEEQKEVFGEGQINTVTIYRLENEKTGEDLFVDLCKGPHVVGREGFSSLRGLGIKLDSFSACYWRGDQERDIRMQRLYALVMETKEELKEFVSNREEAKKRDHRTLNVTQKYFTISELIGAGLALFQPNGMVVRKNIENLLWQLHARKGYQQVWTPHIAKVDLYETSGHAAKFGDELFKVKGKEDDFIIKPMNCPHHMQIFADNLFSYRDMPVRYFEPATVYRDEKTGQLSGLTRVRNITQDDGHLFCRVDQIQEEVSTIVGIISEFYSILGMKPDWVSFSVRDPQTPEAYLGSDEVWNMAESALEEAAKANNLPFKRVEGEAAFYGPKLDFMFKDVLGRQWQLSTIQCDFNLPERFDLTFINEEGEKERPVVIHRAISGSLERFMGILIEHFGGRFPFWLAPIQIKILTVNDDVNEYVTQITDILDGVVLMKPLKYNEIRYEIDNRAESLGKKIREATMLKVPMMIIVGPKDVEAGTVSIRTQDGDETIKLEELRSYLESK